MTAPWRRGGPAPCASRGCDEGACDILMGGTLTISYGMYPWAYERVLIGEAYAQVDGALRKVAERRRVDSGTAAMETGADGAQFIRFTSTAQPGVTFDGRPRGHGELVLRMDAGAGQRVDVLVRQLQ